ncbi:MAG: serine hydroxymethyltransferase [Candidatus Njordarchaeales archaeon]
MDIEGILERILAIVENHNKWRRYECLNMVASENVMSPLAEKLYVSDFMGRYNEHNGESHYQGTKYAMEIESVVKEIFREKFDTPYVELRPLSGGMANLIVMRALTKIGDAIISPKLTAGAHVSHTRYGVAGILGLAEVPMYFDSDEMVVDVDKTIELINNVRPKIVIFGRSVFLFPEPIKEIREAIDPRIKIMYDAAHVFGLIWGGRFQDPLIEGADIITTSTHKTFPGPQGGAIIARKDFDEKLWSKIERTAFPGVVYNHHIHRFPALGITALEMNEFGKEYASQVVRNAKALADELYSLGFRVLCPHKGFTESHQVLIDVKGLGGGRVVANKLEENNIIVTKIALPWDSDKDATQNPSGIRIGVQELTRWGMKESEMRYIAELFHKVLHENKNVVNEVVEFRKEYREIKYCFPVSRYEDYLARLFGE